jgi:uroporphyrinogen-III synthase
LKLILVAPHASLYAAFQEQFDRFVDVAIVNNYFEWVKEFDCLVSPANSFGMMDGGMDAAIIKFFGKSLMDRVQQRIVDDYLGEQPVGTSFIIETGHCKHPFLAHTPTMRVPMTIEGTDINYYLFAIATGSGISVTNSIPTSPYLPLTGKTIIVTRAAGQSSEFTNLLISSGAKVIEMPTLEIGPPSSWEALDGAIAKLSTFNWLILTSTNGADNFFDRLSARNQDLYALNGLKIAVVGKKTALSLQERGYQPDFIPPNFVADALVEHFPEPIAGQKILFPRVESGGREVLVKELTAKGAEVVEVAAYESRCPEAIAPEALAAIQRGVVDVVTFASSKTVKNFCQLLQPSQPVGENWLSWLAEVKIASIGPQTSKTCRELLGRVDVEAEEYTLEGLWRSLCHMKRSSGVQEFRSSE